MPKTKLKTDMLASQTRKKLTKTKPRKLRKKPATPPISLSTPSKSKRESESLKIFEQHKPVDNVCLAAVKFQTKKAARNILDKDTTAEIYIRTFKEGQTTKEGIYKRCRKTRKDGQEFCWKHYETATNRKHPVTHFQKDILEQLGKTVRKAVITDNYLKTGSVSSRKIEEEKIINTQPIFSMKINPKMLEELKRIHKQIETILEHGSVGESTDGEDSSSESSDESGTEAGSKMASKLEEETDTSSAEDDADPSDSDGSETGVDIIYDNKGTKFYHDHENNRIIDIDERVVGKLYQIDCEKAPFLIGEQRYIVMQKTKLGNKPHMRCRVSNLVFDMRHNLVGFMKIDGDKMRLQKY